MKSDSGCATMFQMTAALVFFFSLLLAQCSHLCAAVGDCLANRFCVLLSGDSDGFCTHFGLWILVELQNITNLYLSGEQYLKRYDKGIRWLCTCAGCVCVLARLQR